MTPRALSVALVPLIVFGLVGCAPTEEAGPDPNAGLLRDFTRPQDGKFDEAGHPANARVTAATALCKGVGARAGALFRITAAGEACRGPLAGSMQSGALVANLRLAATPTDGKKPLLTVTLLAAGKPLASATLGGDAVRTAGAAQNFSIALQHDGTTPVTIVVRGLGNGRVDLDYIELFPAAFGVVIGPGSGEITDATALTIETPITPLLEINLNGADASDHLTALLAAGKARSEITAFRRLVRVAAGDLLQGVPGDVELVVRAGGHTARAQLRRAPPTCRYEGDPSGRKVLLTGFEPFPADGWHENVSSVAVGALRPSALSGAQVMRLTLPVEYDRAAAEVVSAIARCHPDAVISFGQGGDAIALEHTAYNLEDTSEVAGGVPDNRGAVVSALPIAPAGPKTRATRLPLPRLKDALVQIGESPSDSSDPGRYVCNNVFYAETGTSVATVGFVHLPYTTDFPADVRARFGQIVETLVAAAVR